MLTEEGLKWQNSYVICPYEEGAKKPLSKEELKKSVPLICAYLTNIDDELRNVSKFNARV